MLERFLRYVRIDTQAQEDSATYPSTAKQLDLSRLLVAELTEIGLDDVELTEHGYVFATLPGTDGAPVIGLIAHVDTTPESPGTGVAPIVHEDYAGGAITLPGDPSQVIDPAEEHALAVRIGHDIVTSDGTTLLGADDKAGVAEIMAGVAYLVDTPEPRATVRVAFTVDEEVGRGTDHFDLERFGAEAAYTLDGSGLGELEIETFSAFQVKVTFRGRGAHPGSAKGKLVNAVKLAAEFIASLPPDSLSPETTDDREGFIHPSRISGGVEEASVVLIVRDHDDALLEEHTALVRRARACRRRARAAGARDGGRAGDLSQHAHRDRPAPARDRGCGRGDQASGCRAGALDSFAAAPTGPGSRRWACRRRTSSPVGRTTTRRASGRASRTWPPPPPPSSSSSESGRNRRPRRLAEASRRAALDPEAAAHATIRRRLQGGVTREPRPASGSREARRRRHGA